jgi:hypothetical protein
MVTGVLQNTLSSHADAQGHCRELNLLRQYESNHPVFTLAKTNLPRRKYKEQIEWSSQPCLWY